MENFAVLEKGISTKKYHRLANLMLGGAFVGLSASYPFHASFSGGLISAMCGSALIGGVADWFAITALFQRPFGIPSGRLIKTEIIPHNRERLLNSLADMVEHELLTKDTLGRQIERYDFADLLLRFLHSQAEEVSDFILYLSKDVFKMMDSESAADLREIIFNRSTSADQVELILGRVLEFLESSGHDERLALLLRHEIIKLVERPEMTQVLTNFFSNVFSDYCSGNFLRKAVCMALPSPEQSAEAVRNFVKGLTPEQIHEWIRVFMRKLILNIKNSSKIQRQINSLAENLRNIINSKLSGEILEMTTDSSKMMELIKKIEETYLAKFESDLAKRTRFNHWFQGRALNLLDRYHSKLRHIMFKRFERFADDDIKKLVESRAGEDLQIIRITGSLVGGLVGASLFMITYVFQ